MLKRIARRSFAPLATWLGYQPVGATSAVASKQEPKGAASLLLALFAVLKRAGFDPKHIVDVGAHRGGWTRVARAAFPNALISMLEPQTSLQRDFQDILDTDAKARYFPVGAGNVSGTLLFTHAERDDSSTFRLSPEEAKSRGLQQVEIPVITLNELVSANQLPIPEIVKIDAEGFDLSVLDGASDLFGHTEVFMVEAGVANKKIANNVKAVVDYMDAKGYVLFDITDLNRPWRSRVLWFVELVFVKKGGLVDSTDWKA